MKSPTIPEVEPQFENEIDPFQQHVIRCETPTLSARRRSSIFEKTLIPDPSVCRWLLDIISEDEHMVVAYTFDVPESQIQLSIEDKGCCAPEPYNREEINQMLDKKLNTSDQIDAYSKTQDDAVRQVK
ncbi:MAG: hypothetical protein EZS28_031964 [Streblomastix strix]|uniref:Uncharacterized protein n=1 Tax=Streblomastix strix TaxID=222440 RepID=A0A5J4UPV4_9EUKA|nr:MAG: hypothetical protein EZS28_031964 [Streblomastix strix]